MFYEVIPTKIFRSDSGVLTYSSDLKLKPGHIVRIPLGKSTVNGIVLRKIPSVDFPTKPIEKLLYSTPLPTHLLHAIKWLSAYYLTPLPQLASLVLPIGVEKKRRGAGAGAGVKVSAALRSYDFAATERPATAGARRSGTQKPLLQPQPLNPSQLQALSALHSISTPTKLLHGITGSGKTNIYLQLAAETLANNKSVILLVPEIALTSQLVQIFCSNFSQEITLIHSKQTESERHQVWAKLLNSTNPQIVIGPRSALFAPLSNLGLIIIDEAHETAYFQENTPKYSALRLASFIASDQKITCLLGSATPNLTDYYLAKQKQSLVSLTTKAKTSAIKPDIHLIKLSDRTEFTKNRYFSNSLLQSIEKNLQNHHQTLIFHNRRGSSPLTICEKCGWQALCPHCFLPLTLHSDTFELSCHTCGFLTTLPHSCPECGHPSLIHKGFGTKLLEQELKKLFKNAKIARFDADSKKTEALEALYDEVKNGDFQIIIGTQTIARGLDLPKLATVGIVQADAGLSLPDYSAEERSFELITQVLGRVGRGHLDTANVFIQTYQPDHPAILYAIAEDYCGFAEYLLEKRHSGHLPPFTYLAKLSVSYKTESIAVKKIRAIHNFLAERPQLFPAPPTPAFHEQSSSGFTWQIILRSPSRQAMILALSQIPADLSQNLKITIDPPSFL